MSRFSSLLVVHLDSAEGPPRVTAGQPLLLCVLVDGLCHDGASSVVATCARADGVGYNGQARRTKVGIAVLALWWRPPKSLALASPDTRPRSTTHKSCHLWRRIVKVATLMLCWSQQLGTDSSAVFSFSLHFVQARDFQRLGYLDHTSVALVRVLLASHWASHSS